MAVDIVGTALAFIEAYGLIAIFILLVLDGAMLLPVFPGEIVLIMAVGAYATDPSGLVFLIVLTSVASMLGSLLLYGMMRGGGRRLVERFPRLFMMPKRRRERMEQMFQKPLGQTLVLFLRVFPLTRVIVNIPAGLAKMPVVRFIILSAIGLVAYHAGFLWFTYEAGRPDSAIGSQAAQLQAAYASPAWDFVQTNAIITGAALVVIGIIASIRASRRMLNDPDATGGSLIGMLAWLILFWGAIGIAAVTYTDPDAMVRLADLGGVDVPAVAERLGITDVQFLGAVAALMFAFALILRSIRRHAKKRRPQAMQEREETELGKEAAWHFPAWHGQEARPLAFYEDEKAREEEEAKKRRRDIDYDDVQE